MPNHITTIIEFESPDDLNRLIEQTHQRYLDYNVDKYTNDAYYFINRPISFTKIIPEPSDEYGYYDTSYPSMERHKVNWYSWRFEHWGTKWDAYDIEIRSPTTLKFETAWSHPFVIIEAIVKNILPNTKLHIKYADEDFGYNLGEYNISSLDGYLKYEWLKNATLSDRPTLNELAAEVLYGMTYAEVKSQWDEEG